MTVSRLCADVALGGSGRMVAHSESKLCVARWTDRCPERGRGNAPALSPAFLAEPGLSSRGSGRVAADLETTHP